MYKNNFQKIYQVFNTKAARGLSIANARQASLENNLNTTSGVHFIDY